jgi:hypothetical protein
MPLNRITFFFEQVGNGWSESLHIDADGDDVLRGYANDYARVRLAISSPETLLTHIRISDDEVFRDIILDPIPLPLRGTFKQAGNIAESPWTALDVRMGTTDKRVQRSLFLRGIPDDQVDGALPSFTAAYRTAIDAWRGYITLSVWAVKAKDRAQAKQPIFTIDGAGNVITTIPLVGVSNLSTIQILGIPRSIVKTRLYRVANVTDQSHFQLRGWTSGLIAGRGFVRPLVYRLYQIDQTLIDAATERRVGRPFGLLRGRAAVIR